MAEYLQEAGFAGNLLLVDISRKMIRKAKQRCENGDIPCVVVLADVIRLPIKPEMLGGIICTFSLTTINKPEVALKEFAEALSPNCQLVILDSEKPSHPAAKIFYPALVPISRMFCHTHIDRDVGGILESNPDIEVSKDDYMGGMVAIYHGKKPRKDTV
jgi:ubiquinone/menaquinone biosynthesis C-methylase UbiE